MKVCDVVVNSIWFDPRVRKQLIAYVNEGVNVVGVGVECSKYDEKKINELPCKVEIVKLTNKGRKKTVFGKIVRDLSKYYALYKAIVEQKADIIHANDLDAAIPAFFASRKLKCKLVYDSHEIYLENHNLSERKILKAVFKFLERIVVKNADLIVMVSNAAADYFEKKHKISRPTVITNCPMLCDMRSEPVSKSDKFEILNHGQFYEGRGYEPLVESGQYLNDYPEIEIVLRGFGRLEDSLRQSAENLKLGNFRIDPPVDTKDLIKFATSSSVGVAITVPICLNFELSISNKIFEYAAAGLPVIMSDIPEHRYLNEKYNFGIILEENTGRCIADTIIKLYTDKKLYSELSENSRKLVEKLNWETEFSELVKIEKKLVK